MKDKKLRKVLREMGIIEEWPMPFNAPETRRGFYFDIRDRLSAIDADHRRHKHGDIDERIKNINTAITAIFEYLGIYLDHIHDHHVAKKNPVAKDLAVPKRKKRRKRNAKR